MTWTADFRRCAMLTEVERVDYTARLIATGHYYIDATGRLARKCPPSPAG